MLGDLFTRLNEVPFWWANGGGKLWLNGIRKPFWEWSPNCEAVLWILLPSSMFVIFICLLVLEPPKDGWEQRWWRLSGAVGNRKVNNAGERANATTYIVNCLLVCCNRERQWCLTNRRVCIYPATTGFGSVNMHTHFIMTTDNSPLAHGVNGKYGRRSATAWIGFRKWHFHGHINHFIKMVGCVKDGHGDGR